MNALVPCLIEAWGGYRSGQTGQTVNLLAQPSQVRILHPPLFFNRKATHRKKYGLFDQNFAGCLWCLLVILLHCWVIPKCGIAAQCGR